MLYFESENELKFYNLEACSSILGHSCNISPFYSLNRFVKCKNCDKIVTDPETKIKMEIIMLCDNNPQNAVRIDVS